MKDKNIFGGGNRNGLYVPMSETEMEVVDRLARSAEFSIHCHGWGLSDENPKIIWGDLRVSFRFWLRFVAPEHPVPVDALDLELRTKGGHSLFREKLSVVTQGQSIMVGDGVSLELAWDIAVRHMDPAFVKQVKPGALGMTTRRLDRDTQTPTFSGNMQLSPAQKRSLRFVELGESRAKKENRDALKKKGVTPSDL